MEDGRIGDGDEAILDVVAPDPNVPVAPFGLNPVVPAIGKVVAVNIAVRARETAMTPVFPSPQNIVEIVVLIRIALVVPKDVIPLRLPKHNPLRTLRVVGLPMLLRPTVRVPSRMVNPAPLNNDRVEVLLVAKDACLVILAPTILTLAAPFADVAVFDDNVMPAE